MRTSQKPVQVDVSTHLTSLSKPPSFLIISSAAAELQSGAFWRTATRACPRCEELTRSDHARCIGRLEERRHLFAHILGAA